MEMIAKVALTTFSNYMKETVEIDAMSAYYVPFFALSVLPRQNKAGTRGSLYYQQLRGFLLRCPSAAS